MTVGNRHDAEDLTTQTFLRMLESIGKFRFQSAPFSAWLFRIAHNLSMDHFRANRRWQPEEDVPEPHGLRGALGRGRGVPVDRPAVDARADRLALAGAAAGADAQVRLQLLERRGGDDPRQDRGRGQVAAAPRARLAAEADRRHSRSSGARGRDRRPAGSGQDDAVHGADADRAAAASARRTSAWRRSRTTGSRQLAALVGARKITPATIRVVDVPGHRARAPRRAAPGRRDPGGRGRLLAGRRPAGDLETLELELLVADRDHVERRLERVEKQAKSGDASLRKEVEQLQALLAHLEAGNTLRDYAGELPEELEPLTTKPLIAVENGPSGIDLQLEAELAEMSDEEAAEFREGGASALDEVVRRLRDALDLITFFTAGEKETRAWTLRRGQTALEAAASIHSDIARGFIRCETISTQDLLDAGSHAEASKRGTQRLEGKTYEVQDGDVLNIRFNV